MQKGGLAMEMTMNEAGRRGAAAREPKDPEGPLTGIVSVNLGPARERAARREARRRGASVSSVVCEWVDLGMSR